ncbi:MAG: hypothetical protein FWJ66_04525 [Caldibacillus sp.]
MSIHTTFENIRFTDEVAEMFATIIFNDEWTRTVFLYIMKKLHEENQNFKGVTINDITQNVKIERPVRVGKGKKYHFEIRRENIERNAASKIVDKLYAMSLLYYEPLTPYKLYFPTTRAAQVLLKLIELTKNEKGDGTNG